MPYDYPDHEERALPHGDVLLAGDTFAVPGGGINLPGIGGNVDLSAYRSLQVVIHNHAASDMAVAVTWDWFNATVHLNPTETQTVLAGATKRMLFRNQGDLVDTIHLTPAGAGGNVDYYVAGSNHDPLARSAPDYLILYGVSRAVDNPVTGDNDHAKFNAATFKTNDASLWSFVLDAGGRIKEVDVTAPGRYESFVQGKWQAAGAAFTKTMVLDVFGIGPISMSPDVSTNSATQEEMFVGAFTELLAGTAQWDVGVSHNFAGNVNFVAPYWWIKRYGL